MCGRMCLCVRECVHAFGWVFYAKEILFCDDNHVASFSFLSFFFLFFPAPPCSAHSSLMKLWEYRGKRRGWDIARAQSAMGRANFGSSEGRGAVKVEVLRAASALCACLYSGVLSHPAD